MVLSVSELGIYWGAMQGDEGKPGRPEESGKPTGEKGGPSAKKGATASSEEAAGNRRLLRIGVVALALVVGVIAWVVTSGDGDSAEEQVTAGVEPAIVSLGELEELADASGHSVYWAGTLPGKEIEAGEDDAGNFQIRYLDEGAEAGGGSAAVLTIGSYPLADPAAAVEGFADRQTSVARTASDGREIAFSLEKPTSVYFAGAEGDVQVEVYDPNPKRAMSLALSERVQPVG